MFNQTQSSKMNANALDQLIINLYQNKIVQSWDELAFRAKQKGFTKITPQICRTRYLDLKVSTLPSEWTRSEEQQLCSLHDRYGNCWTQISFFLIRRTQNNVKNHFYSKLRKSLRALNNIGRRYFRKQARIMADVVIYKLSEAIDEGVKNENRSNEEFTSSCLQLKKNLFYFLDRNIQEDTNFQNQKQLLKNLGVFNKKFKPTPKKQRITKLGRENLKKGREVKKLKSLMKKQKEFEQDKKGENIFQESSELLIKIIDSQKIETKDKYSEQHCQEIKKDGSESKTKSIDPKEGGLEYGIEQQQRNYFEFEKKVCRKVQNYDKIFDLFGESRELIEEDFFICNNNNLQENIIQSCCQIFNTADD